MVTADFLEEQRLAIQLKLNGAKTKEERNKLGQFATPTQLAAEILAYATKLLPAGENIKFLDPAFGTGAFYSALLRTFESRRVEYACGYEIDPEYVSAALRLWGGTGLKLLHEDFTKAEPPYSEENRFNLEICNPPYVRHHHIPLHEKERLRENATRATGIRLDGLSGLYCYFVLLSHAWMADAGIAGWLIPSEFMDVGYGERLKHYLLTRVTLLGIHLFDWENVQFDDALVSSSVVWFRKLPPPIGHEVELSCGDTLLKPRKSVRLPLADLRAEDKWTPYLRNGGMTAPKTGMKLGDLFTIKRGLATGANEFFVLTRSQIEKLELPLEFFRPILPSPRYLSVEEVPADAEGLPVLEPQLFVLDCHLPEYDVKTRYPRLWEYLQTGVSQGVTERYLPMHRSPWYSQEVREPARLLCTYMGRTGTRKGRPFRFILNDSKAVASNVYLLLYPKPFLVTALKRNPELMRQIWSELNLMSAGSLVEEGRSYGGGLHKLEPTELANVRVNGLARLFEVESGVPSTGHGPVQLTLA